MKKIKNKLLKLYATLLVAFCIALLVPGQLSYAQTSGIAKAKTALNTTTSEVSGLYDTAYKALLAIAAIVGIIGGFIVYSKWSSGDPNATKLAAAWFGAALFLAAVGVFIKAIFL
jgi:TRAP-type C4-dicarboxylate transport system permease small subunit